MSNKARWTEADVFAALAKRFADPAYVLLPQVRNSTGFTRQERTADALAISVYPSRGLFLVGIEIKTSVADWKRELAKPEKSAAIQKYCRHWYVAAPKGIVDVSTVPPTWGLLECHNGGTRATKNAPALDAQPVDTVFLCAILRNVARCTVPKSQVSRATTEEIKDAVASETKLIEYQSKRLRDSVEAFEKASGVKVADSWEAGEIGKAVKFVRRCGIGNLERRLRGLHDTAKAITKSIGHHLKEATDATPDDSPLFTESK